MIQNDKLMKNTKLEFLLRNLTSIKDELGIPLIYKYNKKEWVLDILNGENLGKLENKFKEYDESGVDKIDFVHLVLAILQGKKENQFFYIFSILELFKDITGNLGLKNSIKFSDLTEYLISVYMRINENYKKIEMRRVPFKKPRKREETNIRNIHINAPEIFGGEKTGIMRLKYQKMIIDQVFTEEIRVQKAIYSENLKYIFILDTLSDYIRVFNRDCLFVMKIHAEREQEDDLNVVILDFSFSESSYILAACTKDFNIIMWDYQENFKYQTKIKVFNFIKDYQRKIWNLKSNDIWVTTDETNTLHFWDFSTQEITNSRKIIKKTKEDCLIIDIEEIEHLKILAIAMSDKYIIFYSLQRHSQIISLNLKQSGITSICYFNTYQVLLITGYENTIPIFSLTPGFHDLEIRGRLVGHISIVTAVLPIEGSPLVVTSDDTGTVKVWDIRKFSCFQTIRLGTKTNIGMFLDLKGRVGMIGNRVSAIDFDSIKEMKKEKDYVPIDCVYNEQEEEIVMCCSNEIKFVDLQNGQSKRIFVNIFNKDEEDQITSIALIKKRDILVLGNFRGNIGLFDYFNGKLLHQLKFHYSDVTSICHDSLNNIYLSSSLDGTFMAQVDLKNQQRKVEDIIKAQESKINHLEILPYKDIVTSKTGEKKKVILTDVELARLKEEIVQDFKNLHKISKIEKVENLFSEKKFRVLKVWENPKPLLGIKKIFFSVYSNMVGVISLSNYANFYNYEYFKIMASLKFKEGVNPETITFFDSFQAIAVMSNDGYCYCFTYIYKSITHIDLELSLKFNIRVHKLKQNNHFYKYDDDLFPEISCSNLIIERRNTEEIDKKTHFNLKDPELELGLRLKTCHLYIGDSLGGFRAYDMKYFFKNEKFVPHVCGSQSYNPHRSNNPQTIAMDKLNKIFVQIPNEMKSKFKEIPRKIKFLISSFRVHIKPFKNLKLLGMEKRYLMSFGYDLNVKIFDHRGNIYCYINMKHPLPVLWKINTTGSERLRNMAIHVLEVIKVMGNRYNSVNSDEENFDIDFLYKSFVKDAGYEGDDETFQLTQVIENMASKMALDKKNLKKIITMEEEFTPEDVAFMNNPYGETHVHNGPSLRQLDWIRKQKESDNFKILDGMSLGQVNNEAKQKLKDKPLKLDKMLNFFYNFEEEQEDKEIEEENIGDTKKKYTMLFSGKPYKLTHKRTESAISANLSQNSAFSTVLSSSKMLTRKKLDSIRSISHQENYVKKAQGLLTYAKKKKYIDLGKNTKKVASFSDIPLGTQSKFRKEEISTHTYKKKFHGFLKELDKRLEDSRKKRGRSKINKHSLKFKDNPFFFKKIKVKNTEGIMIAKNRILMKEKFKTNSQNGKFIKKSSIELKVSIKKQSVTRQEKRFNSLPRIRRRKKQSELNKSEAVEKRKNSQNIRKKFRKFKNNLKAAIKLKLLNKKEND